MQKRLSKKEKGFADDYIETGNGTRSILNNYDTTDMNTASSMAVENLRKQKIQNYIQEHAEQAESMIYSLSQTASAEAVRLSASKDILDRAGFKPVEKSVNLNVNAEIKDPKAKALADKYEEELKRNL